MGADPLGVSRQPCASGDAVTGAAVFRIHLQGKANPEDRMTILRVALTPEKARAAASAEFPACLVRKVKLNREAGPR